MELRVLNYFLTVAQEASISRAAEQLHISQPTLSRQLKDLEDELGHPLLIREPRGVQLTEEGLLLRKRAEEILSLVEKTEREIRFDTQITGDVYIGAGETQGCHILTIAAARLRQRYPNICIHISSGDTYDVMDKLESGLIDFGLLFEPLDHTRFNRISITMQDVWGVLMPADSPLAAQETITLQDLRPYPVIVSRHSIDHDASSSWFQQSLRSLHIAATYNLAYNASLMVEDGIGYALCLDGIINTTGSNLVFRPLAPLQTAAMSIFWKKHPAFSKAAECFLQELQLLVSEI